VGLDQEGSKGKIHAEKISFGVKFKPPNFLKLYLVLCKGLSDSGYPVSGFSAIIV
jgi:hypothetical protein